MTMTESPLAARLSGGTGMFKGQTAPVQPETPPAPPAPTGPSKNRYAGPCVRCGQTVAAEAGRLAGKEDGKWVVRHEDDACPEVQQVLSIEEPTEPAIRTKAPEIHPGIYTLETAQGHRTFRVVLHKEDSSFAPGSTTIEYLCGPDNDHDYKGFAFIKGGRLHVWKRFREGQHSGLVRDAEEFVSDPSAAEASLHCLRCNATLTVPESIAAGMGPTCIKRGW